MLKPKTTELLPSEPEALAAALLAEGLALPDIERILEMKAGLEAIPAAYRVRTAEA